MHWSAGYIGLPYKDGGRDRAGIDCLGLVRLAYAECRGFNDVPDYAGSGDDVAAISAEIRRAKAGPWTCVASREQPDFRCDVKEWDLIVMLRGAYEGHLGIAIGNGMLLHIQKGAESRVEPYLRGALWYRLSSVWRHE